MPQDSKTATSGCPGNQQRWEMEQDGICMIPGGCSRLYSLCQPVLIKSLMNRHLILKGEAQTSHHQCTGNPDVGSSKQEAAMKCWLFSPTVRATTTAPTLSLLAVTSPYNLFFCPPASTSTCHDGSKGCCCQQSLGLVWALMEPQGFLSHSSWRGGSRLRAVWSTPAALVSPERGYSA